MYGCIGQSLPHSFSKEIHEQIGGYEYVLTELAPEELRDFFARRDFRAVNITIPYKQAVIPLLDGISETARSIGAVNTVVNRGGRLYGYNTDAYGLTALIRRLGLDLAGRKALILGTGGTGKTAAHVAAALGAARVIPVSRSAKEGAVTYAEAAREHSDAAILLNATPCGMYPHLEEQPLPLSPFPHLAGVADAVYNPLRSRLVLEARARGVPAEGGLYMLAAQAVRAAEIFQDTAYPPEVTERAYRHVLERRENIVLIGMPGSGKSSICAALAERLGRPVADTDRLAEEAAGMSIPEIFRQRGEAGFREIEARVIASLAPRTGWVIATGGGAVLRRENMDRLKQNGRLFWLDRPPQELTPTPDRPLADTREKILRLYRDRAPLYQAAADLRIPVRGTPLDMAEAIESGRFHASDSD